MSDQSPFAQLGLSAASLRALQRKGFEEPTAIQAQAIPLLLENKRDLIGQAQTGTGKTAAFGLPLLDLLHPERHEVQALVLTPTRELALQVSDELHSFLDDRKLEVVPVYGGQSLQEQFRRLKRGAHLVVGTPGRIVDHLERGTLKLDRLTHLVLDEADEMLGMGFQEELERILSAAPAGRRTVLFSATMEPEVLRLARKTMGESVQIRVESHALATDLTEQIYFEVAAGDKFEALCRILDYEADFYGLIFCRTRNDVDRLAHDLAERGYEAQGLHGDMSQGQREKIVGQLRSGKTRILVATDVAARGLDIPNLTHVINFGLPQAAEAYVHRIGRTGRAGRSGTAITFITPAEYRYLMAIQRLAGTKIRREQLPEVAELLEVKRERMLERLGTALAEGTGGPYMDLAAVMLDQQQAQQVVASLLQALYPGELDPGSYRELQAQRQKPWVDGKGKTRLLVALGRRDGMSPRRLVSLVESRSGVPSRRIDDVTIMEESSLLTVSFPDAETILARLGRGRDGGEVLVRRSEEPGKSQGMLKREQFSQGDGKKKERDPRPPSGQARPMPKGSGKGKGWSKGKGKP